MSGPVPVSYTDIEAYCRLKGIYSLGDRERLLRVLDLLDREYMADFYAKTTDSAPSKGKDITPKLPSAPRRSPRKEIA